jgi:hypothetical protein
MHFVVVDENCFEEPWVVNMCMLMILDDTSPNVEEEKEHNQPSSSFATTEKTFA